MYGQFNTADEYLFKINTLTSKSVNNVIFYRNDVTTSTGKRSIFVFYTVITFLLRISMWHASSNYGLPDQPGKKVKHVSKEALMASEVHYRRLFETAQDGILILDAKTGRIVDVNLFLIELLGYSKEDLVVKFLWEIGAFRDIYENRERFRELQEKEYLRYEDLPLETTYGRRINVEFISTVYLVDGYKVIQCIVRGISGRK